MAFPNMLQTCVFVAALAAGDCFLPNLMNRPLKFAVSLLDGSEGYYDLSTQTATVADTDPTFTEPTFTATEPTFTFTDPTFTATDSTFTATDTTFTATEPTFTPTDPTFTATEPTFTFTFPTQTETVTIPTDATTGVTGPVYGSRATVRAQRKQSRGGAASRVRLIQSRVRGINRPVVKAVRAYGEPTSTSSEDVIIVGHRGFMRGGNSLVTVKPVTRGYQTSTTAYGDRSGQTNIFITATAKPKRGGGKVTSSGQGKLRTVKAIVEQSDPMTSEEINIITDNDGNDDNMLGYLILKKVLGPQSSQQQGSKKSYRGTQRPSQARSARPCIWCR